MNNSNRLYYAVLACIGAAVCIWFAGTGIINASQFQEHGIVVKIYPITEQYSQTIRHKDATTYEIDVAYRHQNGKEIVIQQHSLSKSELVALASGDSIKREYLPDAPRKLRKPGEDAFPRMSILLLFGLILLGYGLSNWFGAIRADSEHNLKKRTIYER